MIKYAIRTKLSEAGCHVHSSSSGSQRQSLNSGESTVVSGLSPEVRHGEVNPSVATTLSHTTSLSHSSSQPVETDVSPVMI